MESSLENDTFLQQHQINLERSSFLSSHYANKQFNLRQSYNPRDPYGSRLSHYWQPGDNVWSVIYKRIVDNIKYMLNPDTYSMQTVQEVKKGLVKHKPEVVASILIIGIPLMIIYPILRPRLRKVKRQFLFQWYLQGQLLAKRLDSGNVKIPVHEMEQIIRKAQAKVRL